METGRPAAFSGLEAKDASLLQGKGPVPLLGNIDCQVSKRQAPSTLHAWGSRRACTSGVNEGMSSALGRPGCKPLLTSCIISFLRFK